MTPAHGGPAWSRIVLAAAVGVGTAAAAALAARTAAAAVIGWGAAAAVYLVWTWAVILPMDGDQTAAHATREDPSQPASDVLILAASVFSLVAVALLLTHDGSQQGAAGDLSAALAACGVVASWLVTHTVFALRYARLYYSRPGGGIDFNQDLPPRYSDFAYLAFTIGMTYQVSDTDLGTPQIRATALRHGLLSFLLGAVVLATTVNLVANLGSPAG